MRASAARRPPFFEVEKLKLERALVEAPTFTSSTSALSTVPLMRPMVGLSGDW